MDNTYVDGTKIHLGFEIEHQLPVIKTEPEFTMPADLTAKDRYALRYIALCIIDHLNRHIDPDRFACSWPVNDYDNFVCGHALNLNNGYGVRCINDDVITALYMSQTGNIMGLVVTADGSEVESYDILIC